VHFSLEQEINAPRAKVEEAFADARFHEALGNSPNLAVREVLDRRQVGDTVVLDIRCAFTGEISPTVRTFVDPEQLTWITTTTVHAGEHWADFILVPDHHADWLQAAGRYRFEIPDDDRSRTKEVMEGDVTVRVPIFGRAAEKGLVSGFAQHLEEQAALLEHWEAPAS
jgi:hypothetical protein